MIKNYILFSQRILEKVTQTGQSKTGLDLLMQLILMHTDANKGLGVHNINPQKQEKRKNMHALM